MIEILKNSVELVDKNKSYKEVLDKCVTAARICYSSEKENTLEANEKFIANLISIGHESVIEHESLSFVIITNIGCTRELNRHRHNSPNERSTRYVDMSNLQIVLNDEYSESEITSIQSACQSIVDTYNQFPRKERDKARAILPLCTATKEIVTMNLRQIREVLKQRLDLHAHRDIREIAYQILDIMHENYPIFVEDIYKEFNEKRPN